MHRSSGYKGIVDMLDRRSRVPGWMDERHPGETCALLATRWEAHRSSLGLCMGVREVEVGQK
jgi:hypothetical protein